MEKKPGILPGCCLIIMNDIGACVANDPEVRGSRITNAIRISVNAGKAVKFFLKFFPVMPVSDFRRNMETVIRTSAAVTFPELFDGR